MFNSLVARNEKEAQMERTNRPWLRRSLLGLMGLGLSMGLAACGHGPGAAPDQMGMGMGGMGDGTGTCMMGGRGQHGPRGPMSEADLQKRQERMVERVSKQLDLDATQKANLVKLAEAMHAQRQAMTGGQPGAMHAEVQALIAGNRFDTARAQALVNDKTEAVRKGSPQVVAAAATFFDSLKPEQQTKVREFLAKRGQHRGGPWQRG